MSVPFFGYQACRNASRPAVLKSASGAQVPAPPSDPMSGSGFHSLAGLMTGLGGLRMVCFW
jgi:hypothetical protein